MVETDAIAGADEHAGISITNRLAEIARVAALVESFGASHGVPRAVLNDLNVAVDEAVSNVVRHAYEGESERTIDIRLTVGRGRIAAEIVDDGRAFDPLRRVVRAPRGALEERTVGGLGLLFIQSLMDEVRYRRAGNTNRLTLIKRVGPAQATGKAGTMNVTESTTGGVTVLAVSGAIDSVSAADLKMRLAGLIDAGELRLLIDLAGTDYLTSAGFRAILNAARTIEARGGALVLCGIGERARRLFEVGGFDQMFAVHADRARALSALAGNAPG